MRALRKREFRYPRQALRIGRRRLPRGRIALPALIASIPVAATASMMRFADSGIPFVIYADLADDDEVGFQNPSE